MRTLITSMLIFANIAPAAVYTPFTFDDKSLENRDDIVNVYSNLTTNISEAQNLELKKIKIHDVEINVYSEIAQLMETVNTPSNKKWEPIKPVGNCLAHKEFQLSEMPRVKLSCPFIKLNLKSYSHYDDLNNNCQNVYSPEIFMNEIEEGKMKFSKMNDLPEVIQMISWPLKHVNFADNLITPQLQSKFRLILTKVRMDDLLSKINSNIELSSGLLKNLEHERCFDADEFQIQSLKNKLLNLNQEAKIARDYLLKIDEEGKKTAQLDRQKIIDQGKVRPELPYPNLTDNDREVLSMYLTSILWRMRGGGVFYKTDRTQPRRIFYVWKPLNMLGYINGGETGASLGAYIFPGLLKMWGQYFDMGTNPVEQDRFFDITKMTERGLFQVKFAEKYVSRHGYTSNYLRMAGLQMGPVYYYATYSKVTENSYQGAGNNKPYLDFTEGFTDYGELFMGATLGLSIARTYLQGHDPKINDEKF